MNIISIFILSFTPVIKSEETWTSSDIRITEEWSLNVLDLIEPAYEHIGSVYGVETEEGYKWHTILVGEQSVLHYEEDNLLTTIGYSGDIYRMTFSNNHQFLLAYCYTEQKLLLFDLQNTTVSTLPLFSGGMSLPGFPLIRVTDDGTVLVKHSTYLRLYDSNLNCTLSLDDFHWYGNFVDFSHTGDSFFTSNDEQLYAWDMNMNPLWSVELPERYGPLGYSTRELFISQDYPLVVMTDFNRLYLYSEEDGNQVILFDFNEKVYNPIINESGSMIAITTYTDPETTPQKPVYSFGVRTLIDSQGSFSESDLFEITDFRSQSNLPYSFTCHAISNEGYILGLFHFNSPVSNRVALISPSMEILWLSCNRIINSRRFINPAFDTSSHTIAS